jgi:hypothetical protein
VINCKFTGLTTCTDSPHLCIQTVSEPVVIRLLYHLPDGKGENILRLGFVGFLMMLHAFLRYRFEYMSWMGVSMDPAMYWTIVTLWL